MKFIYVLEDDVRIQKDLFESLKLIDAKFNIRFFTNLSDFNEWLKLALHEGAKALAQGGQQHPSDDLDPPEPADTHELCLLIAKNEILGTQNMGLVRRTREFFQRKKLCSEQQPTAIILTAFDSPNFDIKQAEDKIINNVIFKPFDKLILGQDLEFALNGNQPIGSSATVATIKINSTIEMLKEVSSASLSEIGFTTLSTREIVVGTFAKYYADAFRVDSKKSIHAYCHSCKKISEKEFLCEFHFFAADNQQISGLKKLISQFKEFETTQLQNNQFPACRILIFDENATQAVDLKNFLSGRFYNCEVFVYNSLPQLISDLGDKESPHRQKIPVRFDFVFANYDLFEFEKIKLWQQICENLQERSQRAQQKLETLPPLFLISKKKIPVEETRELGAWVKDIFFTALDKAYITKKLVSGFSALKNNAPAPLTSVKENMIFKAASPVEITQISETGLILKYPRAISIGAFREFILWRPEEIENPEIIGTTIFNEADKSNKDIIYNHFVFFGMKDHYLKHIRLWLRDSYIKQKEKE